MVGWTLPVTAVGKTVITGKGTVALAPAVPTGAGGLAKVVPTGGGAAAPAFVPAPDGVGECVGSAVSGKGALAL